MDRRTAQTLASHVLDQRRENDTARSPEGVAIYDALVALTADLVVRPRTDVTAAVDLVCQGPGFQVARLAVAFRALAVEA